MFTSCTFNELILISPELATIHVFWTRKLENAGHAVLCWKLLWWASHAEGHLLQNWFARVTQAILSKCMKNPLCESTKSSWPLFFMLNFVTTSSGVVEAFCWGWTTCCQCEGHQWHSKGTRVCRCSHHVEIELERLRRCQKMWEAHP